MAKRKRLDAPDAEEVARYAESFAADQPPKLTLGPSAPPIARVARDTAQRAADDIVEARRNAALNEADATRWRSAQEEGRVSVNLPLGAIETDHLSRDRMALDDGEMSELRSSLRRHGLRMPIEVVMLAEATAPPRYGLISGWRRLQALRTLWAETGDQRFSTVAAFIRRPRDAADAYVSMVEENEVRANLSHYERGRIAAVAAEQGAFATVETAVDALFGAGSKAKRSKIRSFAQIHESLGDVLRHGPALSERAGLRVAAALRSRGQDMRQALARLENATAEDEWRALEPLVIATEERRNETHDRPGNARRAQRAVERRQLPGDVVVEMATGQGRVSVCLTGTAVDDDLLEHLVSAAERYLASRG